MLIGILILIGWYVQTDAVNPATASQNLPLYIGAGFIIFSFVLLLLFFVTGKNTGLVKNTAQPLLKKSEKDFELLVNGVKDYAIFMVDTAGKVASWNNGARRIKGYTAEEILGQPIDVFYTAEALQHNEPKSNLQMALQQGHYEAEGWRVRKDGIAFWANVVFTALYDEQGLLYGYAKVTRDITEKMKAGEQLRFLATIADNIQDPVISTDTHSNITRWNKAAELLLEWKTEEVIGKNGVDILKVSYLQEKRETILVSLKQKNYWQGEVIYHTKSGRPVNVLITASQLKDAQGNITGNLAVVRDITERKKDEEKLKEFKYFFDNSNDFSCIANTQGHFEIINPSFNNLLGYSHNELSQKPFLDFVHPDDVTATVKVYEDLKAGASVIHFSNRYRKKDGTYLLLDWNATPNTATGKLYCIARDITERKKAEDALSNLNAALEQKVKDRTGAIRQTEAQYRYLFQNNPMPMWVIDLADFKFLDVNEMATFQYGYSRKEFLSMTAMEIRPEEDVAQFIQADHSFEGNDKNYNKGIWRHRKKDGSIILVDIIAHKILFEGKPARLILAHDVTAQQQAKEQLIQNEKRFRALVENSDDIIGLLNEKLVHLYRSPSAERITGYTLEERIKSGVMGEVHPEDNAGFESSMAATRTNPGKAIPVTYRLKHKNGHYIWLEGSYTNLLHDPAVGAIVANVRDVTERKTIEQKMIKLNEELEERVVIRTEQLRKSNEELEAFSYSVSHDLRAPLRAIIGFSAILQEDYKKQLDDEAKRITGVIINNTKKMGQLIDDLLTFSRMGRQEISKSEINTSEMVKEIVEEIDKKETGAKKINWVIHSLPPVMGDINIIRQVWINLLSNAAKYSAKATVQNIEIGTFKQNGQIAFVVKDNGVGFDEKYKNKLFKVFQRLHSADDFDGTGIGLAIVEKIISKHGGKVWAQGEPDKGASFYFSLPIN